MLEYNHTFPGQVKMVKIVVALTSPYQVIMSDSRFHDLLQFSADEMIGRSLNICMGPLTNSAKIDAAIRSSSSGKAATIHVVLYSRHGEARNIVISCSPFLGHAGEQHGCLLELESSEARTIHEAMEESASGKALISAEQPCIVQMINDAFTSMFGFTNTQMVGRSLRIIQGPRADASQFNRLVEWASTGRASSGKLWLSSSSCFEFHATVSIVPIVDAQSDCISNLMVLFDCPDASSEGEIRIEPSGSGGGAIEQPDFEALSAQQLWQPDESMIAAMHTIPHHRPPSYYPPIPQHSPSSYANPETEAQSARPGGYYVIPGSRVEHPHACPLTRPTDHAPADAPPLRPPSPPAGLAFSWATGWTASSTEAQPRAPPRCATIRRRRAPADDADDNCGDGPRPASITLELLESMADLTIVAAAQRIRVSTTSLKKACRKLGVERWPYRKDRPAAAATAAKPTTIPRDFDEAYVRRLHRKYGGSGARRAGRPAGAGISRLESAASHSSVSSDGPEPEDGGDAAGAAAGWADRSRPEVECGLAWGGLGGCAEGDLDMAL